MKRLVSLLAVFALCFTLAACKGPQTGADTPTTSQKPEHQDNTPLPEVAQKPMVSVFVPTVTETVQATDGTVIFRYTHQNMIPIVPDPDVADTVILDFYNRIDKTAAHTQSIQQAAQEAYQPGTSFDPYMCEITYDPMRMDACVLSLFGSYTTFSGTPHPETSYLSVSYDLATGQALTLQDVLNADTDSEVICNAILASLSAQKEDVQLYAGYEETVKERFSGNILDDEGWFFDQEGLCFYFSPYEIGPYTSRSVTACVPYEKLTGILDDAYFPPESEEPMGSVLAVLSDESKQEDFSQYSEAILDTDGTEILLYTDQYVQDLRIDTGSWSADGTFFVAEHTVFAAYSLTPGDAVMLQANFTDGLPAFRLRYTSNGAPVTAYLSCNDTGVTLK